MGASGLQCRVGLGFSRAEERDDGHGGDSGGQRRRGDATTTIVSTTTTGLADGYDAGICGCEAIVVSYTENGGVDSLEVIGV